MAKSKDLSHPLSLANAERPNQPINNQPNNQNRSSQSLARSASTCVKGGKNCGIVAGGARVYLSLISLNPDEPGHHHHCSARADTTNGPGRAQTGGRNGGQSRGGCPERRTGGRGVTVSSTSVSRQTPEHLYYSYIFNKRNRTSTCRTEAG